MNEKRTNIGPDHLAHLLAAHANVQAAQGAFQLVQTTIARALDLPDGIQIAPDGTILWPPDPGEERNGAPHLEDPALAAL